MQENIIGIGLIGQYCSGKDSAAQFIKTYTQTQLNGEGYTAEIFNTDANYIAFPETILNRVANLRVRKEWRSTLAPLANEPTVGSIFFQALQFADRFKDKRPVAIINSVESMEQAKAWESLIPTFRFIYVQSDLETRLYNHNSRKDYPDTEEKFLEICGVNNEEAIGKMKHLAMPFNLALNIGKPTPLPGQKEDFPGLRNLQKDVYGILDDIL